MIYELVWHGPVRDVHYLVDADSEEEAFEQLQIGEKTPRVHRAGRRAADGPRHFDGQGNSPVENFKEKKRWTITVRAAQLFTKVRCTT